MSGRVNAHSLNRDLEVWRPTAATDEIGGRPRTRAKVGKVRGKVSQSTAQEQAIAAQAGATHTHNVHLLPDADVRRGDELRGAGEIFAVNATFTPSTPAYLKAEVERRQSQPSS